PRTCANVALVLKNARSRGAHAQRAALVACLGPARAAYARSAAVGGAGLAAADGEILGAARPWIRRGHRRATAGRSAEHALGPAGRGGESSRRRWHRRNQRVRRGPRRSRSAGDTP